MSILLNVHVHVRLMSIMESHVHVQCPVIYQHIFVATVGRSFFEGYIFHKLRVFVCFREFYLRENWLINHY